MDTEKQADEKKDEGILKKLFTNSEQPKGKKKEVKGVRVSPETLPLHLKKNMKVKGKGGRPYGVSKYESDRDPVTGKVDYGAVYARRKRMKRNSKRKTKEEMEAELEDAIRNGKRDMHFCCPICHRTEPLTVRVGSRDEKPLRKEVPGIMYVKVGNQYQKRFLGPGKKYYPVKTYYRRKGLYENEKENLTAGQLLKKDRDYFFSVLNAIYAAKKHFESVLQEDGTDPGVKGNPSGKRSSSGVE